MTNNWHPLWGHVKESKLGDTTLYQLNGRLYTFTSLEPDEMWNDFWHYGVNWYAAMEKSDD